MSSSYYVRYGLMGRVGCFPVEPGSGPLDRGQMVVVRTPRGQELGEVLVPATDTELSRESATPRILRVAGPDDLARNQRARNARQDRLDACERLFGDGIWPIVLVDVEPLLDERRTVLYYLGPHRLDSDGLSEAVRETCGLDVILEPVGRDEPVFKEPDDASVGCGSGGCGSGGGCGTGGCGTAEVDSKGGGCTGCAVKEMARARSRKS